MGSGPLAGPFVPLGSLLVTMTRNDAGSRFSSMTGSSTDSARSSITVKPLPLTPTTPSTTTTASISIYGPGGDHHATSRSTPHPSSRRAAPSRLKTDENGILIRSLKDSESQVSPTSTTAPRLALSPSSAASNASSMREHRMSDLTGYRRDLAILDPSGGRTQQSSNQQNNPATGSLSQIAPWMANTVGVGTPSSMGPIPTTFYNDSTDNLSLTSQLSPGVRAATARPSQTATGSIDSPDMAYFTDERRPSVASITTTASSQGSRTSGTRGGFRKLQGFFGEEFPGRDSSETSLSHPGPDRKEHRSHSYSHGRPPRDRNYSNATDYARDSSPSSRPRTPVPAPEVVPFLYQEADDIARYGEAPVRDILSGPDRERFMSDTAPQNPPKTSSSSRSGHSIVHLPGHHRHNKSNEDSRALRPSISREDSTVSLIKERSSSTVMFGSRSRAQSPAPSMNGSYWGSKNGSGSTDGQTSPGHTKKQGLLGRWRGRGHKDKDDSPEQSLKKLTPSSQSLQSRPSRQEFPRIDGVPSQISEWPTSIEYRDAYGLRPKMPHQATFNNKFPFAKKGRTNRQHDDIDEHIGPTDRHDGGTMYHLDTNLNDMEGILSRPLPLTPMDADFLKHVEAEKALPAKPHTLNGGLSTGPGAGSTTGPAASLHVGANGGVSSTTGPIPPDASPVPSGPNGVWYAPDSWAVRRGDEVSTHIPEGDDIGSPPRPEEKLTNYCIRVFRSDGTFATLQMALDSSVSDVVTQIVKKSYVTDGLDNYHIILKKHDLVRVLNAVERPLLIQKRLLQQVGYEDRDRIEDIGREDNSYLCRFLFLSARESDFHATKHDLGLGRMTKFNHVDLSGRNLITIPVPLYSKASEIISLNLSRNLSLDLPRDFIQSCQNLRDVKFNNNEARKLPLSLSRANKLTYLDVSNNRLEQLEHAELGSLTGLLKLNLANNRLNHLPPYFGAYRALRTLNISSNFLDKFPSFLCDLESLVDLDLSFNLIGSFPDSIGKLRSLEKFVITNNRLSGSLPQSVKNLCSLRELDIKYNTISNIDVISELPKLEILAADHNAISQFTGTFERIRSLKLNSNPITKFEIKSHVPTLKVLNLSNAQLASIDESFNNMLSLERLVLDKNYFVSLPNQIGNLKRLEHLSISNNSVRELPPEIGCLTELRVLDVRGNNIRKLPMEIWWANKLETLNASSNVLENFPKPASRPPQPPAESVNSSNALNGKGGSNGLLSQTPSTEELNGDASRRPSQASSTLLSVGPSPVPAGPDRKSSLVSVYGKGGRKTSVISRSTTQSSAGMMTPTTASRKDSGLSQRLTNTFAGSLRNLYLADNQLDDDVFDQITLLSELRVLNLSYNDLNDMPQRSIKSWPQLVELYLSGNELTSLPADDLEEYSLLQTLHINNNKFTNLPADISRAKKLAVLDCGSNSLKYNIANVPYDWNWNLNPNLRYLNLSGNRRLEIKQSYGGTVAQNREQYTDFNRLLNLRVLGLMDVTLTQPSIPDQSEDRRVRTSGSLAGYLMYGMADTLGKNEHLSTIDLVVPRFNSSDTEVLLGLFDGQALSSGGSKIAKYLHENFGHIFTMELKAMKPRMGETPEDALRRAFLALNKDLVTVAIQHTEERPLMSHRGSTAPVVLSKEDLNSGGVATVVYLQSQELYVANVGDVQAMLIQSDSTHRMLTKKHDPADPHERSRIRDAGGWVSRNGRLNDLLEVSRAFGYVDLMPAVQAAPHIMHTTIKEQDETILIATRELWEFLPPGLVVDVARSVRGDLMRAAQKLRDLAIAYGSTSKIMVMMISVADLKRRNERSRMHRGQSMSWFSMPVDESGFPVTTRRDKKTKREGPLDSQLARLDAEVPAPTGLISIVFTDIKNSTQLWETYPEAMRSAIKLHNEVMRRQLRLIGGFEVKTEGDAFMVSFPTATSALLWCFAVQIQLLSINWPNEMLHSASCQPTFDRDNKLIFKGLSVRMGIHWGEPLAEPDPVTRRMDYYGPMVNKASRISAVADGGQIAVSSDFISEIQRCLETYQESSVTEEDGFEDDSFAKAIRNELRSLSSQGFEVKDMGEKKLKGLENPEFVYSLYPHALAGRIDQHTAHEKAQNVGTFVVQKPAVLSAGSDLSINPEDIWALWRVALRLEMLCSTLEEFSGRGLQPPETELLERMKQRGGEVTERFLVNFMEHQVSRIETCISTLAMRHMAIGGGPISQLSDLRAPMSVVLSSFAAQLAELQQYKARFGELEEIEDGSDTEQE
ncbi:phosphatase 2C-domain-containing protein [Podospora didyma]|uniref:Adenylate cyclase n=1 Tax=Podospora didyma TaxID=330526 RepID=A0AAE0P6W1_9PEZI|nr:phosphatase 2C-domain-containing protein [Podospora didyma]